MATLLKPWITRYLDEGGKQVPKATPGARKVKERAAKWYGQFIAADGRRRRVPLATDKAASRQMLAALERDAQRGKAGLGDPYAGHRKAPIDDHIADFEIQLRNKGVCADYLHESMRRLRAALESCEARVLGDLSPEGIGRFLAALTDRGTGPTTRNHYLTTARAFSHWCVMTGRMEKDPLAAVERADEKRDVRRRRRALTEDELARLLKAAQDRPVTMATMIRKGPRQGKFEATLRPEFRAEMERVGRDRSLMYKTMVHTGLRRGELEALEVRHLTLAGPRPCLTLPASSTKNAKEADIPIRPDLARDLAEWIGANGKGRTDRVFRVSPDLNKFLKLDLKWAGIPQRDEHGRTVDVHAFRHTTATYLGRGKVTPRIAQGFMRHGDIRLTMQTYTDPRLLDESEALAALPDLPLDGPVAEDIKKGAAG